MAISGRDLERAIITEFCTYASKLGGNDPEQAVWGKRPAARLGKSNRRISWQKAQRVAQYWGIDELVIR